MKALILALWFAAPFAAELLYLSFSRGFMDWSGGSFDPFGDNWIWLKCTYFGLIGFSSGLIAMLALTTTAKHWLLLFVPILMSVLDFVPKDEPWTCSYTDQAIDFVGYAISRVFPYIPQDKEIPPGQSPVIQPLTHIAIKTPKGTLAIISGHGLLRTYEWDGVTRLLELFPPDKGEHSFHSRRYSEEGVRIPAYDWEDHKGITRGEAWESRVNFKSMHEANSWLEGRRDKALPCVWTHDGLVVGWSTDCDDKSLTILVYQVLINSEKPSSLAGSDDSKFAFRTVSNK
jgi:hypothetical protein